jgi:anti-sigma factor RsiW
MECRNFEERLEDFVAGNLPLGEQGAVDAHLSDCARCRRLLSLVRGDEGQAPRADESLILAILHKTSGAACPAAALHLCDWIDGCLPQDDWEFVSLHIDHCPDCRSLAAALQELRDVLPEMAEIEPDGSFTDRILALTVGPPPASRHSRPHFSLLEWWRQTARRPRFAWEAAYVGALLVLLALGNPARLPLDAPKVTHVSRLVMRSGGQIMQETATALADRGKTAKNSIRDLRLQTRAILSAAAEYQDQTTSTVRRKASSFLEELKLNLFRGGRTEERQDARQP